MGKIIIIFGLITTVEIAYSVNVLMQKDVNTFKNSNHVKISTLKLTAIDLKTVQQLISQKSLQSQFNSAILDLSKSPYEVITKENSQEVLNILNANLASLFDCFIKSKCNVSNAVIKVLIARHLELIKISLMKNISISQSVNWIVVRECSGLNNENIRLLSADLLFNYNTENDGTKKFLKMASTYTGKEKADFLTTISEALLPSERKIFILALKDSFNKDDSNTIELIVKKLNEMGLKKIELAELESSFCKLKTNKNWNEIKLALASITMDFEKNCI